MNFTHIYSGFWSNGSSHSLPSNSSLITHHSSFHAFIFKTHQVPLSAACMCMSAGPFIGAWVVSQGPHPWRKLISPPLAAINCQQLLSKDFMSSSLTHAEIFVYLILYRSCASSHRYYKHTRAMSLSYLANSVFSRCLVPLALTIIVPLFCNDPCPT